MVHEGIADAVAIVAMAILCGTFFVMDALAAREGAEDDSDDD